MNINVTISCVFYYILKTLLERNCDGLTSF
jgi:hypothetical protein